MTRPHGFSDAVSNRIDPEVSALCHPDHVGRYDLAAEYAGGGHVLDVGCGFGYGAARLAAQANSVVGVDIHEEAIRYAAGSYGSERASFRVADATALPFAADTFDLVTCFEVIEHVDRPVEMLTELRRVLLPGGRAIVSTPNRDVTAPIGQLSDPTHLTEFTPAEFRELLAAAGFEVEDLRGQHIGTDVWDRHWRRYRIGQFDRLRVRRLLPRRVRLVLLKLLVPHRRANPANAVHITADLEGAHDQIAVCRKPVRTHT